MNLKIKFAYLSIILSILSFTGVFFGGDGVVFAIFAIGCLTYSYLALHLWKKEGVEGSSKAFLGGFIAMTIFLIIHVFFLIMTLTFINSDTWKWGWQFFLTLFGIIPAVIVGAIIGGIIDLFSSKKSDFNVSPPTKRIVPIKMIVWIVCLSAVIGFVLASAPIMAGNNSLQDLFSSSYIRAAIGYTISFAVIGILIGSVISILKDKKSNS